MPRISILIPLYRSSRFQDVIAENIRALSDPDVEVILSDRNGDDSIAKALRADGLLSDRVKFNLSSDNRDWVDNINALIESASGDYFRILPHDDSTDLAATMALVECLETQPEAVLAYGRVAGLDEQGNPMPERDHGAPLNRPMESWTIDHWLDMFWTGSFGGAFKGVVRTSSVRAAGLSIRKTRRVLHSERVWLFGLCAMGKFAFVDQQTLRKRFYRGSTSQSWQTQPADQLDTMEVMVSYCEDLVPDTALRAYCRRDLQMNAFLRYQALVDGTQRPVYRPYPEDEHLRNRSNSQRV
ncbi:MAG: glycosyltransferase [Pseudomonadota bacterium]